MSKVYGYTCSHCRHHAIEGSPEALVQAFVHDRVEHDDKLVKLHCRKCDLEYVQVVPNEQATRSWFNIMDALAWAMDRTAADTEGGFLVYHRLTGTEAQQLRPGDKVMYQYRRNHGHPERDEGELVHAMITGPVSATLRAAQCMVARYRPGWGDHEPGYTKPLPKLWNDYGGKWALWQPVSRR